MDAIFSMSYPIEIIPDRDFLFTFVHFDNISKQDNLPLANAFLNTPHNSNSTDLSSDWDKYVTDIQCRNNLAKQINRKGIPKNPENYFIWKTQVFVFRNIVIPNQNVIHTPRDLNRAHSSIVGKKTGDEGVNNAKFRSLIIDNGDWSIAP